MDDKESINKVLKRAEEYQEQREIKFAILQLEVLKTKLNKIAYKNCYYEDGDCCQYFLAMEILNKYIAELKGENK